MKRNISISEQAKILFESIQYPIQGFIIFATIISFLIATFILIQISSSTTQSTKIVPTGERYYINNNRGNPKAEHYIVYFQVDEKKDDTEIDGDSLSAQISVHYFAFFPFVFSTLLIMNMAK